MRKLVLSIAVAAVMLVLAAPSAFAQRRARVPNTGMTAIGGWIGAALPRDPGLTNGLELAATIEQYVTPRVSVRGEIGAAFLETHLRGFNADVRPLFVDGDVVYNWEGGAWHPYVEGGLGLEHYTLKTGGAKFTDNKLGANFGGGVEYFLNLRTTLVGDVRYHAVPDFAALVGWQGSYWTIAAGLKRYF
jgi:hypothetical protein